MMFRFWWLPAVLCSLSCSFGSAAAAAERVDFRSQVAPILREKCLRCHGANAPEGGFSLTHAAAVRESGFVTPGQPLDSTLLDLIKGSDADPPAMPKEGAPLNADEIALLTRWIAEGAAWPNDFQLAPKSKADEGWWSLQPLQPGALHSIDAYIRVKLKERGLTMASSANRQTLIRRLRFDLHGLPPTPEQVRSFTEDAAPDAYPKLVDRLLSTHHFGERFAQHWLDIAHYADTHGFERDRRRDNAWRYRDYVIRAFNEDKPYDRFIQEQIAGDILWPQDTAAVVATGFLAAGPWDYVGQVETKSPQLRREARSLDLDDMATQVLSATVGLTVNCARCHDHKLDPISQREYYQLRAVFASLKREDRVVSESAVEEHERQVGELRSRLAALDYEISRLKGAGLDLADIVGGGSGRIAKPPSQTEHYRTGIDPRNANVQTRDFGNLGNVVVNRFSRSSYPLIDGVFIPNGEEGAAIAISSTGLTIDQLPETSGNAWDAIRNGPVASQHSPVLDRVDFSSGMNSLLGLHANAGITFDLAAIRKATGMTAMRLVGKVGYFGAEGGHRADAWILLDAKVSQRFQGLRRTAGLQDIELEVRPEARFLTLISTDGGNGYSYDQVGFGNLKLRSKQPVTRTPSQREELGRLRRERSALQGQLENLGPAPRFFGVTPSPSPPPVHVLARGDPESPVGPAVAPAALQCLRSLDPRLGELDSTDAERRVALARWLASEHNPLAARVIVNRLWHWHFGTGLVDTPSDFGYGGGRPSHPELLDWLAQQLRAHNGSLKAIHRLILLSDTYRQSSRRESPQAREIDANNRLLWRQNNRRLEAEGIRDAVLATSGDLNLQAGGPGFEDFRYQDAYAPIYSYMTPDKPSLWRRSIYRYRVRTTPNRFMTTLDCPDTANLTPKRVTTTTALQALTLYNNPFMLQQAEHFAERLRREVGSGKVQAQAERGFWLAFGRSPNQRERSLSEQLIRESGLFTFCRSLLNANEFIYVD